MAKRLVMIVGGGLAGLAAAMKLAELDCEVSIMSLTRAEAIAQRLRKGASTASTTSPSSLATTSGSISRTRSMAAISSSTSRR